MRLKSIKLAGFKSFVDPTSVPLPTNLIGIVGPNGCGKSNIIDAVRWVMGETSAKTLRGDSMSDVIFSGSSTRKPVGQATVELLFDNSDATIGGEFAKYNELSIKRIVNREAQSQYLLNGTRCRRRDITGIFLGTGLGSRSYSVIAQDTISRLIEAKPEELRVFIEEAAGISKYKERRRETENRIRHTRENLERLTDIREELGKHLDRLDRQAKAAEKYQEYRTEERSVKAQLLALRWQVQQNEWQQQQHLIKEQEIKCEASNAEITEKIKLLIQQKDVFQTLAHKYDDAQTRYYKAGSEIARLEEAIQHQKSRQQQLSEDLAQANTEFVSAEGILKEDQEKNQSIRQQLQSLEPKVSDEKTRLEEIELQYTKQQEHYQDWLIDWDEFNKTASQTEQKVEIEQARIQQVNQQLENLKTREDKLLAEQSQLNTQQHTQKIQALTKQREDLQKALIEHETCQTQLQEECLLKRDLSKELTDQLDNVRNECQQARGRFASLEALQQDSLGKNNEKLNQWLDEQNLSQYPRLAETLEVKVGWEQTVEMLLGENLQAIVVKDFAALTSQFTRIPSVSMTFLSELAVSQTAYAPNRMSEVILNDSPLAKQLLNHIHMSDSLDDALTRLSQLSTHESIVTRDGYWLGQGWLRIQRDSDENAGVLQRQQELQQLNQEIQQQEESIQQLQEQLSQTHNICII